MFIGTTHWQAIKDQQRPMMANKDQLGANDSQLHPPLLQMQVGGVKLCLKFHYICIYVCIICSKSQLKPHDNRSWLSQLKPTSWPDWTIHNQLCVVWSGF